jgi:hypothetical protein
MSYCGYLGVTVLNRLDGKPFSREMARKIKNGCRVEVFLSRNLINQSACILASRSVEGVGFEEVKPYIGSLSVRLMHYQGGLYNPTMFCEIRDFDELDDNV